MSTDQSQAPLSVDPARVPVYPMLRLVVEGSPGSAVGQVDGVELTRGSAGDVERALIAAAAAAAARRPCQGIRVTLEGFTDDGAGVVTADGSLVRSAAQERRSKGRRLLPLLGLLLVGLVGAAAVIVLLWVRAQSADPAEAPPAAPPTGTPTQVPVVQPDGWSSVATWSAETVAQPGAPVASSGSLVFVADADGGVSAVRVTDGAVVWQASASSGVVDTGLLGGPVVSLVDGSAAVVAWTSSTLSAWSPETGEPLGSWSIGSDGEVRATAAAVVVVAAQGHRAAVLTGDGLVWRVVPAEGSPVGTDRLNRLLVVGQGRGWSVSDARTAGEGTPVAEAGMNVTALGATRDLVLLAVGLPDSADVVVQAVDARTWQPEWRTPALPVSHSVSPLALSSTLSWAVYGQSIIDLEDGTVTPLPEGWATTGVAGDVVLGVVDAGAAVAARDGTVLGRAEGVLAAGPGGAAGEWLLYVASDGVANRVYAVPRSAVS